MFVALAGSAAAFAVYESFESGKNWISVRTLQFSYQDVARDFIGGPASAVRSPELLPSCLGRESAAFETTDQGQPICRAIMPPQPQGVCNPVEVAEITPTLLTSTNDLIEVKLAAATADTPKLANFLGNIDDETVRRLGPMAHGNEIMLTGQKDVHWSNCGEFGLVDIRQHYYSAKWNFRR